MEKSNKQKDNAKEVTPKEGAETIESSPVERSKPILVWLAIVILLGLITGSFWYLQQQLQKQQLETATLVKGWAPTELLENQTSQLKQAFTDERNATEQKLTALNAAHSDLLGKVDSLAKSQDLTNDDVLASWILAELKFLLQTANQSALLTGDITKAQIALTLADQQIKSLTDPRMYQLRSLISDEQLALASVAKVDIDGLAMQLQSALNKVAQLQVLMGPQLGEQEANDSTVTSSSSWEKALSQAWLQIKSLVVIRHQEDVAEAVLVPEQRYFLYQNLSLKLESARLALLSGRESIFHDSLASAELWLQQYFIGVERDAMLELLKTLRLESIVVEVPDISASLIWLQQYGDQQ